MRASEFSAQTAPNASGATAAGFGLHFFKYFARKEVQFTSSKEHDYED
jgi:hypothetical protein